MTDRPDPPAPGGLHRATKPVDILIVDDTPSKLLALESALSPLGENLVPVRSGREALRHLLDREFATVILDVNMPDLDGFETARMIRSRQRSAGTPIIFTSAVNIGEADTSQGYALGAVDYICSPIAPEVLRAKVSVFVELHRKSEEAKLQAKRLKERSRELEQSQQDLRMSERMASLGTLCAGLGHDMGNLLLPISVWVESVRPGDLPEDLCDGLDNLRTCIQYLRKLASGLRLLSLDSSRKSGDEKTDLLVWSGEIGPVLRNALPRGVALEIAIENCPRPVRIAPHRLAQVALNLVQNAGEVLRETPDARVLLWAKPDRDGVRVGVSDNGPGMSKQVMERCLDPFFTTKTRGISTGLGLSLVHSIIQAANSKLELDSVPGRGTTFAFRLELVESRTATMMPAVITIADLRKRAIVTAIVQAAGCQIMESPDRLDGKAGVWITDSTSDLASEAEMFLASDEHRRVFLIADEHVECAGVHTCPLTGATGLAASLRKFLAQAETTVEPVIVV